MTLPSSTSMLGSLGGLSPEPRVGARRGPRSWRRRRATQGPIHVQLGSHGKCSPPEETGIQLHRHKDAEMSWGVTCPGTLPRMACPRQSQQGVWTQHTLG